MKKRKTLIGIIVICSVAAVLLIYIAYGWMCRNELKNLKADEVESVFLVGTTGGFDGYYEYTFSDGEIYSFVELLNKVQLGHRVSEEMARSSGASSHYTISYKNGEELKLSPGEYFELNDKYYIFTNWEELWEEFIVFNSMRGEE